MLKRLVLFSLFVITYSAPLLADTKSYKVYDLVCDKVLSKPGNISDYSYWTESRRNCECSNKELDITFLVKVNEEANEVSTFIKNSNGTYPYWESKNCKIFNKEIWDCSENTSSIVNKRTESYHTYHSVKTMQKDNGEDYGWWSISNQKKYTSGVTVIKSNNIYKAGHCYKSKGWNFRELWEK